MTQGPTNRRVAINSQEARILKVPEAATRYSWRENASGRAECEKCDLQKREVQSRAETRFLEWNNEGKTDREGTQTPKHQTAREATQAPKRRNHIDEENIRKKRRTFPASLV